MSAENAFMSMDIFSVFTDIHWGKDNVFVVVFAKEPLQLLLSKVEEQIDQHNNLGLSDHQLLAASYCIRFAYDTQHPYYPDVCIVDLSSPSSIVKSALTSTALIFRVLKISENAAFWY